MGRKKSTPETESVVVADPITTVAGIDTFGAPYTQEAQNRVDSDPRDEADFSTQFTKMYEITNKIVEKILANGGTLKQDSYVVREEFGEAMAAGYRYLRNQGAISKKLRDAGHDNEERNYVIEMYEEFADVFMMSTSFCRHNNWTFENKPMTLAASVWFEENPQLLLRKGDTSIETYLSSVSEMLFRINNDSVNEDYMYEFICETYSMLLHAPGVLERKIDKLYNKICKVVE